MGTNRVLILLGFYVLSDEESVRSVTLWVVADVETVEGRDLMYSAIKHAVSYSPVLQHSFNLTSTPSMPQFIPLD